MRIVIDLQGAQSESRYRGIGRYSLSLSLAIARNRGPHQVILALSGLFPETIEPLRTAFEGILPRADIRVWTAPGPTRDADPGARLGREVAERMREAFLAAQRPDAVLLTSLFEGFGDDAVTSIGTFGPPIPTAVILYDLIPLLRPDERFRADPLLQEHYRRKLGSLRRSRLLLAISESAKQEACAALAVAERDVVNISGACDESFGPPDPASTERETVCRRAGITRPFVLYAGGADERKNLHRLIHGFAELPAEVRGGHQLVFVGKMPASHVEAFQDTARRHGLRRGDLVIAGYVDDAALRTLYGACALFVFPSTHEGFGIPPLEAMACGAPVIGADATSLPEVIGLREALFDPLSIESISRKLGEGLTDELFRRRLIEHGRAQAKTFSWDESARRTVAALQRFDEPRDDPGRDGIVVERRSLFAASRKRILVIKLDHLGDFILAIPALARLRARYPHADIEAVVGSWSVSIAESLGIFSAIHTCDLFRKRSAEAPAVSEPDTLSLLGRLAPNYDIALDLRRQRDSRFLLARVKASTKVGYETFDPQLDGAMDIVLKSHPDVRFEVTALNRTPVSLQVMRLVDALPPEANDYVSLPPLCRPRSAAGNGVAVFPKAGNAVKEWSGDNYAALIRRLLDDAAVDAVDVYFADDGEAGALGLAPHARLRVHVGLGFAALTESLSRSVICIANNSFGAHLGSYLGLAVIAIYGGHETVGEWAPVFNTSYVIHRPVPCSPCHIAHVPECPYGLRCLTEIGVEAVYARVREALSSVAANRSAGREAAAIRLAESGSGGTLVEDLLREIAGLGLARLSAGDRLRIAEGIAFNHAAEIA